MSVGNGAWRRWSHKTSRAECIGYPWQPCEQQPPNPSLQGAWRAKGLQTGWGGGGTQDLQTFQAHANFNQNIPQLKGCNFEYILTPLASGGIGVYISDTYMNVARKYFEWSIPGIVEWNYSWLQEEYCLWAFL